MVFYTSQGALFAEMVKDQSGYSPVHDCFEFFDTGRFDTVHGFEIPDQILSSPQANSFDICQLSTEGFFASSIAMVSQTEAVCFVAHMLNQLQWFRSFVEI